MAPAERGPLERLRKQLVSPARGRTIEVGAGTGLNFAYYEPSAWVVATDPDAGMIERARARAVDARASILLTVADAEALPFRDAAFAEGIVALAMCTIAHPERALAELRRALEPGARLRLIEHVRVDKAVVGRLQDWLTPFWRRVAGGCHLNRRTAETIASSGFALEVVEPHLGGYLQVIVARRPAEPLRIK
jgi:ubiquinone/menaquinone biosynthesis C-methylase UbiE